MANKAIKDFTVGYNTKSDYFLFQRDNKYYSVESTEMLGGMIRVRLTITQAQMQALSTTPQTLLAAQGAGTYIEPVDVTCFIDYNGTAYATLTTLRLNHSGQTNLIMTSSTSFGTSTADLVEKMAVGTTAANLKLYENTALVVSGNANATNNGGTVYIDALLRISKFSV
jgi:hypothetical protein